MVIIINIKKLKQDNEKFIDNIIANLNTPTNICDKCKKQFTGATLKKYNGLCGKCYTASGKRKSIPKRLRTEVWKEYVGNKLSNICYSCDRTIYFDTFECVCNSI